MRVGRNFKNIRSAMSVGSLVCVELLKNCLVKVRLLVGLQVFVFLSKLSRLHGRPTLACNVFGLCVRAGFGAQNCQLALNLNRSTKLQVCTSARLTQNRCYGSFFLSSAYVFVCFVYQMFRFFKVGHVFNGQLKVACSKVSNFSNVSSLTWHWLYFVWI